MTIDWPAIVGVSLISVVLTLMLFPFAERKDYLKSRPASFIAGVLFMPLFVAIAVMLQTGWADAAKATVLVVLFLGFWASAAWLVRTPIEGSYVRGLEFGPGLNFRPDLILPGGVMLVKGIILTGVGTLIAVQGVFGLPKWSWSGFILAFFGIITIIPIRGMAKMIARRERFLGNDPRWQAPVRWALLVGGLAVLLYGFLSAFMGGTPFVDLLPKAELAWLSVILLVGSSASLWIREVRKANLLEGTETMAQRFASNLWLYISILAYMYGFIVLFMGTYMYPHPGTNPWGVVLGAGLFTAGLSLMIGFRPFALRNELSGTIGIMVGMLSALEKEARWKMMMSRIRTIAAYPAIQCTWHVGAMSSALDGLSTVDRERVETTRNEVMMSLSSQERQALMMAMDQLRVA
ncbi:MAG TPA: hypothetical protein ENH00_14205 [Actinobacteria bacterium]|nr:hypothetical protein [Actinomycetota bacterium]